MWRAASPGGGRTAARLGLVAVPVAGALALAGCLPPGERSAPVTLSPPSEGSPPSEVSPPVPADPTPSRTMDATSVPTAPETSAPPAASSTSPAPQPSTSASPEPPPDVPAPDGAGSDVRDSDLYRFTCSDDEATVAASGAPRVTLGDSTIYVGGQQVSSVNQDPLVVRFDGGRQAWCRDDLERNGDDGRAYGLLWSGEDLVVAVSATGTQGEASGDLRRFTGDGWLRSYSDASPGGGGGPQASVVVRLDPATGDGIEGTWLTAVLSSGKTNSLRVTSLALDGATLVVGTDSWYSPRGTDRRALSCRGDSPFPTTYTFTPDLTTALSVVSDGCS